MGGLKPTLQVLIVLLLFVGAAHAQTTQPKSVYEGQPIKRSSKPAEAEAKPEQPAATFDWQRLVLALGIVLGLIFALKLVVGRMYPGMSASKGGKAVRVLARSPIAPKQQVLLLQVGRRLIVVGDSAGTLTTLGQIDDADEVAELVGQVENIETPTPRKPFASLFGRAQEEFAEPEQANVEPAPDIAEAQTEISGLIERMRTLTKTVRRTE